MRKAGQPTLMGAGPALPGQPFTLALRKARPGAPCGLPACLPPGASLVFQAWIVDWAGPYGWAASNGLAVNVP